MIALITTAIQTVTIIVLCMAIARIQSQMLRLKIDLVQMRLQREVDAMLPQHGRSEGKSSPTFMGVPFKDIHASSTPECIKEAYAKWLAGPGGIWTTGGDRP